MKRRSSRIIPTILAVLISVGLAMLIGLVGSTQAQAVSEKEKQLRHSIDFWDGITKNGKVILVPLSDKMTRNEKARYINTRTNPDYRSHYVRDPRSGKYYVPADRDEFLNSREKLMTKENSSAADINAMKRYYDSDSDRMKKYVTDVRLPSARKELSGYEVPIPAGSAEQRKNELYRLVDRYVPKWDKDLQISEKDAVDSGPRDERAALGYWATNHLKLVAGQAAYGTPAQRNRFMDYIGCLDRVYSSHFKSGKEIKDGKNACRAKL